MPSKRQLNYIVLPPIPIVTETVKSIQCGIRAGIAYFIKAIITLAHGLQTNRLIVDPNSKLANFRSADIENTEHVTLKIECTRCTGLVGSHQGVKPSLKLSEG